MNQIRAAIAIIFFVMCLDMVWSQPVYAGLTPGPLQRLFTPISYISPANFSASLLDEANKARAVRDLCATVNGQFRKYQLADDACGKIKWKADIRSKGGAPLLYAEFGSGKEISLLLGGVHPDEITPIPIAFRVARWLEDHPEVLGKDIRIVIAPLVNPDGFLKDTPTRTNANGVDVNRNFFTFDWYSKAKDLWVTQRHRSNKHFPGYIPNSEVETLFQIQLIDTFQPVKIMSIHAPLGFLDYDGPGDGQLPHPTVSQQKAKQLVKAVSEKSRNYRIVDYTFYPGSLGNFAGNERNIPTVTLEFESTDPSKVDLYWQQFLPGIKQLFNYPFSRTQESLESERSNASPFFQSYVTPGKSTI